VAGRIEEHWDRLHFSNFVMSPLAGLYGLGWLAYRLRFDLGFKKPFQASQPVICVGSLMAGGAAKSPVTLASAEILLQRRKKVVVSLSGYRSQRRKGAFLAPDGPLEAKVWGDETAVFRDLLPEVPLVTGKDRVESAKLAHEAHPDAIFLMDDGYQHWELTKDVTILMDPDPTPNPFLIPAGPYREPRSNGRSRASLCLPSEEFRPYITEWTLKSPIDDSEPSGEDVQLLCAIGRPFRMVWSLEQAGKRVVDAKLLPDHDPLDAPDLWKSMRPDVPIVMTHKDWVKVRERKDWEGRPLFVARLKVTIKPEESFGDWLISRLPAMP
jgi:tetraacyldisaccharide 4'-kinase